MKDYRLSDAQKTCQKYYPTCCTTTGDSNCPLYDGCCLIEPLSDKIFEVERGK